MKAVILQYTKTILLYIRKSLKHQIFGITGTKSILSVKKKISIAVGICILITMQIKGESFTKNTYPGLVVVFVRPCPPFCISIAYIFART